jgi:Kef-type K+ transport system membrane component KefB
MEALSDLALIWVAVYVAVVAARKTRLTPVLYFLFLGFVMVNVGLLPHESHPFVRGFAELGIIVIMFMLGFEETTNNFLQSIKKSWGIAFFGALAPFVVTYSIAEYYWQDTNLALMCGLAMTATAVSLTMVSLRSEGLQATPAATRIMTSAVLDDIGALALVAILVPLASGERVTGLNELSVIIGKILVFFVLVWIAAAWLLPHESRGWISRVPVIGRFGARHVLSFEGGQYATLAILIMALLAGLLAYYFGFHPAVGAYMAGLILREEYFERRGDIDSYQETRRTLDSVAYTWIGPVFFVQLGTQLVFDWDIIVAVIPQTITLLIGLFIAQVGSASLAARYTSGMDWPSSVLIGFGMLGRAELAFVVMDIAYTQNGIIHTEAFYTLMLTAFWLNVSVPLTIKLWKFLYDREAAHQ